MRGLVMSAAIVCALLLLPALPANGFEWVTANHTSAACTCNPCQCSAADNCGCLVSLASAGDCANGQCEVGGSCASGACGSAKALKSLQPVRNLGRVVLRARPLRRAAAAWNELRPVRRLVRGVGRFFFRGRCRGC